MTFLFIPITLLLVSCIIGVLVLREGDAQGAIPLVLGIGGFFVIFTYVLIYGI